jgi:predicted phage terminase large subunit-like protein
MAKSKLSSDGRKVCAGCGQPKSATEYASTAADTCLDCVNAAAKPVVASGAAIPASAVAKKPGAPRKLRVAEPDPTQVEGENDEHEVFPQVEIDPNNPTDQELAARIVARRNLLQFIKRFRPNYKAGWVHEDICRRLQRFMEQVEQGLEPRLLLMVPVRHGKSEISSRHFPAFVLGHHPDWEIIAASGASSLAMSFSRYLRDVIRDQSYRALFPDTQLDSASQSVENWGTTHGGGYLAAGIGTMITGRGAHILIIDDPVKDAEAADSPTIRDNVWEWYMSTAYTRLAPGGGVLGIMTWWNEDDWAGRIQQVMATGDGDVFEIVKYPAINDIGDEYILADDSIVQIPPGSPVPEGARLTRPHNSALHPERYSYESLMKRKANYYALGQQRWWAALYQQNPTPEEGAFFTKDMFKTYVNDPHPSERAVYQAWDFAITEKAQSDYTVGSTGYLDVNDNLYVTEVLRFRSDDAFVLADAILDMWEKHGSCAIIGVEDGQIWKSIESVFLRRCEERRLYPSYEVLKPFTDKFVRAQPLRGRMQVGKVWFKTAAWFDDLRNEFLRFGSGGKNDDQVDSVSWLTRLVLLHRAPRVAQEKKPKSWKDRLPSILAGLEDTGHMAA